MADQEGYETFVIPDNIGGNTDTTPVGLLPMAVAGIDIDQVVKGAHAAANDLSTDNLGITLHNMQL